ncbi:fibrocystin-L-like isoform X1 [Scylla paramamosain]|uniref:fibrocystin-L-like isoform X1 n=1 Tax=Scylla paramamosain TaxID=85552 RepID=UPI003082D4CE
MPRAFVGSIPCDIVDENLELYDTLTREKVTCRSKAKLVGPMNATVYVTGRGASEVTKTGMYVDSQDRLYQFHTYAGMRNVSPLRGSSQGGTLFTIDGAGFDPYKEQTKVLVGGAQCAIQDITDEQIRCLTPTQGKASAGSGEHRLLVELYQGEYFESNFLEETSWAALSPSHAGYKAFVPQDAELKFPIEVTRDTVGTLKGYLHPPHDGTYSLSVQVGERMLVMLAANGDSDSEFEVMQWQEFELKKGTPAYLEIRFQTRGLLCCEGQHAGLHVSPVPGEGQGGQ